MKKTNRQKGITLVALVITIIILLILAGISIQALTNTGLFGKAQEAKEEAIKAQLKEEISLAIQEIQIEELPKGNDVTLESLANGQLVAKLTDITAELGTDEIVGEYKKYQYTIDTKFNVKIEQATQGIGITYELSNYDYTNQEITLTIHATSTDGKITNIQGPSGISQNEDGTYTITKNGDYEFIVTDNKNNSKAKTITISNIDKIAPKDYIPDIKNTTSSGFTIVANAEDGDETEESSKSGIARYEYYINDVKYESESNTYSIDTLEAGTEYIVYVIAYDKAGNSKRTENLYTRTEYLVKTYLYQNGNEYTDITGGWNSLLQSKAVCTKTEEYVYMVSTSSMSGTQTLTTAKKINITDYKKLIVKANCISFKQSARPGRFGVYDEVPTEAIFGSVEIYENFLPNGVTQEYELDISQVDGEKSIVIYGQPEVYIYEVYLAK